ncbi:25608_t:CDS:1, partial [Gigaspora rosea]
CLTDNVKKTLIPKNDIANKSTKTNKDFDINYVTQFMNTPILKAMT